LVAWPHWCLPRPAARPAGQAPFAKPPPPIPAGGSNDTCSLSKGSLPRLVNSRRPPRGEDAGS